MSVDYEENKSWSQAAGWILVILLCGAIVGWGYLNFFNVKDAPRHFDHGSLQDVPGQSIYSSSMPSDVRPAPPQILPLPEAHGQPAGKMPAALTTQPGGRP